MPTLSFPYEITKLFKVTEDKTTGEKKIDTEKNYAYTIQDNLDQIKKILINFENRIDALENP